MPVPAADNQPMIELLRDLAELGRGPSHEPPERCAAPLCESRLHVAAAGGWLEPPPAGGVVPSALMGPADWEQYERFMDMMEV